MTNGAKYFRELPSLDPLFEAQRGIVDLVLHYYLHGGVDVKLKVHKVLRLGFDLHDLQVLLQDVAQE